MIKVFSSSKVYVYTFGGMVTGGVELTHQLVDYLRKNKKIDAYIVYIGNMEYDIPDDYRCYDVKVCHKNSVENSSDNIEVFTEGQFHLTVEHAATQKLLWWISVDHFYFTEYIYLPLTDILSWSKKLFFLYAYRRTQNILSGKYTAPIISIKQLKQSGYTCAYQAEYIQSYLLKQGFDEMVPLKDFINTEHAQFNNESSRENMIIYNPRKGLKFTKRIIGRLPGVKWVPIQNMDRREVIDIMRRAKIYIDFGYHPGKDRMPREAALNGCCVITGRRGSANFFEDVSIPGKYRFDENKSSIDSIVSQIRAVLDNYKSAISDFEFYTNRIRQERHEFYRQIDCLFFIQNRK